MFQQTREKAIEVLLKFKPKRESRENRESREEKEQREQRRDSPFGKAFRHRTAVLERLMMPSNTLLKLCNLMKCVRKDNQTQLRKREVK